MTAAPFRLAAALISLLPPLVLANDIVAETDADPDLRCGALLERQQSAALQLDYTAFDQTPGSGFRVLAEADCPREAADLIEAYLQRPDATQSSLRWHLAQMRAEAGQTDAAVRAARQSLRAEAAADAAFRWNDYVHATIAFLQKDRPTFDQHHRQVTAAAERHPGNAMNGRLLDALGRHFDASYREAVRATR